jgi:hypothetical protein
VTRGLRVGAQWNEASVSAPRDPSSRPLAGDGWTLDLAPEWSAEPGARLGDVRLVRTPEAGR